MLPEYRPYLIFVDVRKLPFHQNVKIFRFQYLSFVNTCFFQKNKNNTHSTKDIRVVSGRQKYLNCKTLVL